MFYVKTIRLGNSLAVVIPKEIVSKLGLREGIYLSVRLEGEKIVYRRA